MGGVTAGDLYLGVASLVFLAPCIESLLEGSWTTEAGALGPLVLAAGLGTLWSRYRECRQSASPGNGGIAAALLVPAALGYLAARAINMSALLCAAGWLALVAVFYAVAGREVVRRCWFPLLFLLIVIPLPYALTVEATAVLRNVLADGATRVAAALGLEVAVNGYAVYVDQYELSIESACAGLSSTVSLLAVGLLYAYWVREAGWKRMALIALAAFPVALLANLLRIVLLLGAVHWGGASVLATPLHPISGFVSFALALAMLLLVDGGAGLAGRLARRGVAS
jgi:exosortase